MSRIKSFTLRMNGPSEDLLDAQALSEVKTELESVSLVNFSIEDIKKLIRGGKVKRLGANLIQVDLTIADLKKRSERVAIKEQLSLSQADLLFEDEVLIVVKKPTGIPSQPTLDPKRDSMGSALSRYLYRRDGREGYLALHHRLDVDTSGALIFCRKKSFNKAISDLFSERKIEKCYLAIAAGKPLDDKFRVHNYLAKARNKPLRSEVVKSGDQVAITDFEVLKRNGTRTLLKCTLQTGRFHQIRVHLKSVGAPIIGDGLYGGEQATRLMLHAHTLRFKHPKSGQELFIEAPAGEEFLDF